MRAEGRREARGGSERRQLCPARPVPGTCWAGTGQDACAGRPCLAARGLVSRRWPEPCIVRDERYGARDAICIFSWSGAPPGVEALA